MDLQSLQENFSLPGVLSFAQNEAGLVVARIATDTCEGELYLQGAHVTHWQPVGGVTTDQPVLFLSPHSSFAPGKAIRGGVPVIFPWFGDRKTAAGATEVPSPAHGFARTQEWTLAFAALAGDDLHITLTLAPSEQSRALGYDGFRLALAFTFGETLKLQLTVANDGTAPLHFEEALHTYLAVGDAEQIRLNGLNDTEFLDKTKHFARTMQAEPTLTLHGETDRIYVNTTATVLLEDPVYARRVFVTKNNSRTTVVWNPWAELSARLTDLGEGQWRGMTCVETANAAENAIELPPGAVHVMEMRISVEPL